MQSHNSFSIDLDQQNTVAKARLRAIRQSDEQTLSQVQKYHAKPYALSFNTIELADVQYALARELGLRNWSELIAHVENLEFHKKAISQHAEALDGELNTLHVRCGHDIQVRLKESGFKGDFLAMIDPLCIGPIPANRASFLEIRAQYVADTLLPVMGQTGSVKDIISQEQSNIKTLLSDEFERIVFWVEHDAYDQFMLLRCLLYLENINDKAIEVIEVNHFPGTERFIGFGQLPAEALRSCWQLRQPINARLMNQAKQCWNALTSDSPNTIVKLYQQNELDCLPNIRSALMRHLQELPHSESGLSFTQRLALDVLAKQRQNISLSEWFRLYQQREPLPFLGDVMFFALMLPLASKESPLITLDGSGKNWGERQVSITRHGNDYLEGTAKFLQQSWVGGIQISKQKRWVWDHAQLSSLSYKDDWSSEPM